MTATATPDDPATLRRMKAIMSSPCLHLETCVEWTDDNGRRWAGPGRITPADRLAGNVGVVVANTLQRRIEAAIHWCREQGRPGRVIVLKGRRSGSSVMCTKVLDLECKKAVIKGLVMAHAFKRTDEIFAFVRDFAATDVFPWRMTPPRLLDKTITYGNKSEVMKETALDPSAGRAAGIRCAVLSECAHYPSDGVRDANKMLLGLLNTVPKTPESLVLAESTANGISGWFAETWQKARWVGDYWQQWESGDNAANDNGWVRVFAGWHEIPRNVMPVNDEEREVIMGSSLTPAEETGVSRYGWTAEQLRWRRWTIASECKGSAEQFDQEFPSDPQSAFLASGSPAFSRDSLGILRTMAERSKSLWEYGVLEAMGVHPDDVLNGRMSGIPIMFRRTPKEEAWFARLEDPEDGCEYIASCDPATGASLQEDGGSETDLLSAMILRKGYRIIEPGDKKTVTIYKPRLIARLMWEVMEHHPTERQTLYMLSLMCRYYGGCSLVVETNKGEWVIVGAKQAGLDLYRETIHSRVEDKLTTKLGFTTTEESRHSIVTRLQSLVHGEMHEKHFQSKWEPSIEIEDLHVLEEMETFVRDKKGRFSAASGRHDDDVFAVALAAFFLDGSTKYRERLRKRKG